MIGGPKVKKEAEDAVIETGSATGSDELFPTKRKRTRKETPKETPRKRPKGEDPDESMSLLGGMFVHIKAILPHRPNRQLAPSPLLANLVPQAILDNLNPPLFLQAPEKSFMFLLFFANSRPNVSGFDVSPC